MGEAAQETVARCAWCNSPFPVKRKWQRFCKTACRVNAHDYAKFEERFRRALDSARDKTLAELRTEVQA